MKILIYSDNHWCQYSSIVRKRGEKYSLRLENQIKSLNWVEDLGRNNRVQLSVCCGDFFDTSTLNAEELSALKEVNWYKNIPHYFLCGNHEMGSNDLQFNSVNALLSVPNAEVIDTIHSLNCPKILLLPYILEENRKPLKYYISKFLNNSTDINDLIVFSHNDIKGIQMGAFVSEKGFEISDIENNCALFINGHLHNGAKVSDKIINVGNLTGQNFSEDAFKYEHCAYILDTATMKIQVFKNPFALNFYKIDLTDGKDWTIFDNIENAVLTVKCFEKDAKVLKNMFAENSELSKHVIEIRYIIQPEIIKDNNIETSQLKSVDHLEMFKNYILETLGNSETVNKVLSEVIK